MVNGKGIAAAAGIATATVLGAKEAAIGQHDLAGASKFVRESSTISREAPLANNLQEVFASHSNGPMLPPKTEIPLRVANLNTFSAYSESLHSTHKLSELIDSAQPKLDTDLSPYSTNITSKKADEIIKSNLVRTINEQKKSDSGITFELISGKLKIDSKFSMGGVNISGGEINVYKISGTAAVGVAACRGLGASEFQSCVNAALAKAVRTEISSDKATER